MILKRGPLGRMRPLGPVGAAPELILGFEKNHIRHEQNVAKKEIIFCSIHSLLDSFQVCSSEGVLGPSNRL